MGTYLDRIVADHRRAADEDDRDLLRLIRDAETMPPAWGFARALRIGRTLGVIAEIKRRSPSKGDLQPDLEPAEVAKDYERGGAACLSVLTDEPSFGGADDFLVQARAATALPCIRKDFLLDPWQVAESRALGADCILVILAMVDDAVAARMLSEARRYGMGALVEVHDEAEMARAGDLRAELVGINNRDLRTFEVDLAVTERLAPLAPRNARLVTESGIATPADAARMATAGATAMLVGESLMRQADVETATRALLG